VEADGGGAAKALAQLTATAAKDAVAAHGCFTLAVAGGSLIKTLTALKELPDVPWDKFHVFWVDERCVPHRCVQIYRGVAQLSNKFQATAPAFWPSQPPPEIKQSPGRTLPTCLLGQWEVREVAGGV